MNKPLSQQDRDEADTLNSSFEQYCELWKIPSKVSEWPIVRDDEPRSVQGVATAGFISWDEFHCSLSERGLGEAYSSALTGYQRRSYLILREYFASVWHDEEDVRNEIRQNLSLDLISTGPREDLTFLAVVATLFFFEMDSHPSMRKEFYLSLLLRWRVEAVKAAAAQRSAYSCLLSWRMNNTQDRVSIDPEYWGPSITPAPVRPPKEFPNFLWSIHDERTIGSANVKVLPAYTCISHTWGRWETVGDNGNPDTVTLAGVPWKIPRNSRFDVTLLPSILRQTRWTTEYLWVDLFCIPQLDHDISCQTKEIAKQASIFAYAQACVAWLNDIEDWTKVRSAIDWLSVSYLRHGSGLFCKDIDSFEATVMSYNQDGRDVFRKRNFPPKVPTNEANRSPREVQGPLSLQAYQYHSTYCCSGSTNSCPTLARMIRAATPPGKLPPMATLFGFPDWTTSLWTLQEACLCSDMSLASSKFEYLQTETGMHFRLDDLICLIDFNRSSAVPPSVKQLRLCFPSLFGYSTPMKVMLMANERECSGARAPAIMSVLGFTDWYKEQIEQTGSAPHSNTDLVLGKYPLPFVEEARSKIGALIFATCPTNALSDGLGSMLPFFAGTDGSATFPFEVSGARKDARVNTWTIQLDGRVEISNAIIFAANQLNPYNIPPIEVEGTFFGLQDTDRADLQTLLDKLCCVDDTCVFAVHLSRTTTSYVGIILLGFKSKLTDALVLRKSGAYEVSYTEDQILDLLEDGKWPAIPAARQVQWTVF